MLRPFYSAILRQKHKYVIGKKCYGRGPSFTISATKYMTYIIPHKGIKNT